LLLGTRDLRPGGKRAGKKKKKKPLVLTLGSPPEKGGEKKKTLILTLGRSGAYTANPPEKGKKKKKKNCPGLFFSRPFSTDCLGLKPGRKKNPGQLAGPQFLDLDLRTWVSGPGFQDLGLRTWVSGLRQMHATHPTVVSSFSRHFSLRPLSLFFFSSRSLCIQWSQTHRRTHRQVN
jgi:hypothetical protein